MLIIVYNIHTISSLNINQVVKMTVNWQTVFVTAKTQFNAGYSINFTAVAKTIDELINECAQGTIGLGTSCKKVVATAFYNKAMASRVDLIKLKLD